MSKNSVEMPSTETDITPDVEKCEEKNRKNKQQEVVDYDKWDWLLSDNGLNKE